MTAVSCTFCNHTGDLPDGLYIEAKCKGCGRHQDLWVGEPPRAEDYVPPSSDLWELLWEEEVF